MKRLILGLAAFTATALIAGPAFAWTANANGSGDCDGTTFTVQVGNEPGTHTAALTFAGETKTQTVPAEGGNTITFHFNSPDGGDWSYQGTWSDSDEVETDSGTLPAIVDCEQEEPTPTTTVPPTTAPPVEEPKDDEPQGSSTSKTRTIKKAAPAPVPTPEPAPKPPVSAPTPDALPFTGPYDYLRPIAAGLFLAGLILLIATRRRTA